MIMISNITYVIEKNKIDFYFDLKYIGERKNKQ